MRLVLQSVAEEELTAALEWYIARSPATARRFLTAVEATFDAVRANPETFPIAHGVLRRASIRHFPYGIYYRVFPNVITVVAIVHARRHPRRWYRRG